VVGEGLREGASRHERPIIRLPQPHSHVGIVYPRGPANRLNRSGNRQLNRALHTILLVRQRIDPDTRAYVARRTAEGKSRRDAKRCLRRVIAI
jgi:hypothetical protein